MISHLDYLMSLTPVSRDIYGHDQDYKPNDYCVWTDIGYSMSLMAWVETDSHFRERIKEIGDSK